MMADEKNSSGYFKKQRFLGTEIIYYPAVRQRVLRVRGIDARRTGDEKRNVSP